MSRRGGMFYQASVELSGTKIVYGGYSKLFTFQSKVMYYSEL